MLAIDPGEQEIARQCYAGFISRHSHKQMLVWHQHFIEPQMMALIEKHKNQIAELTERFDTFINSQSALSSASAMEQQPVRISRPIAAQGNEAIYDRFMAGSLIYRPNGSELGQRVMPIASFANPETFEGEFNLNGLTYTSGSTTYNISDYLRIKLGCRTVIENEAKTTVWLVPQFVARAGGGSFSTVSWTSDVGIFWTWGQYGLTDLDYLTSMQFDEISTKNLHGLAATAARRGRVRGAFACDGREERRFSFIFN